MHFTSRKFSLHIVYIFKKAWDFLIEILYSDQMFSRNIITLLRLKSETETRNYSFIYTICKYLDMVLVGNLH